jgi:two-component system CheB/CheR fusion protein
MLPYRVPSTATQGAVASFLDVSALHEVSRLQQIVDALAAHIAVLDSEGTITMVNKAWREFAGANGDPDLRRTGPGMNYLRICEPGLAPVDGYAEQAGRGLREVLDGRSKGFSIEYPCHSPDEERWFLMHVSAIGGAHPGAVVSHVNITRWWRERSAKTP